jgi:hypothetical protein
LRGNGADRSPKNFHIHDGGVLTKRHTDGSPRRSMP